MDKELEKVGANRPSTIKGIEQVAVVESLLRAILPWRLSNSDVLKMQSEEVIRRYKAKSEGHLAELLSSVGF
jgi:hypothetical protein